MMRTLTRVNEHRARIDALDEIEEFESFREIL